MDRYSFLKKHNKIKKFARNNSSDDIRYMIIDAGDLWLLKLICSSIKEGRCLIPNLNIGDLALCIDEADAFSELDIALEAIRHSNVESRIELKKGSFLSASGLKPYSTILLVPQFGFRFEGVRSEIVYVEKCLDLLEKNGKLIMLLPQNILVAPLFKSIRQRIIDDYSLDAVIGLGNSAAFLGKHSIVVVSNKPQIAPIYMTTEIEDPDSFFYDYEQGRGGFFLEPSTIVDRIDPNYYDPKFKEQRTMIQRRDAVKLGDAANVFFGAFIPQEERKETGEYIWILPSDIQNGTIVQRNRKPIYCDESFVYSNKRGLRSVLKNGDVLVSLTAQSSWAIYNGSENYAIANHNIAIIRGKKKYEKWIQLFFNTKTGIEYLESQLGFLYYSSPNYHISLDEIRSIYIPDLSILESAKRFNNEQNQTKRIASLFHDLGWDVAVAGGDSDCRYDIELFYKNERKAVVEVKSYSADRIINNKDFANQLQRIKHSVGDAEVYLFVDDDIYRYEEGSLEQLLELPRPGKTIVSKKVLSEGINQSGGLSIESGDTDEVSISDRTLLRYTMNYEEVLTALSRIEEKIDNITDKIEALTKQINGYQSLVSKQLDYAVTADEEERIIHAFSEECTERILGGIKTDSVEKEYNTELNKLIYTFGEAAWNKMDDSSKSFLVSSKVVFNSLINLNDIVDYSGVCLLVTKALEVEVGKRFCKNYLAYLKEHYPGKTNYSQYPTGLLNEFHKPIKAKQFTLGKAAYILCLKSDGIKEEQINNNKEKLVEFSKEELFPDMSGDEIFSLIQDYAESIEEVKNDYRNPSAHTNQIHRTDAEECFALVVDVEKLLKRMLDSFYE